MKIDIKDISKQFGTLEVLRNIDLLIPEGKVTAILGPSGCGKTTLLNILSGTITDFTGTVTWKGEKTISYLFQEPRLLPWKSVEDNLRFVLANGGDTALIDHYLSLVGLLDFKQYYPGQLSGGMKQRAAIARAFIFPADVILMDEPFQALDLRIKLSLVDNFIALWMQSSAAGPKTAIFVTHDVQEALLLGDSIVVFSDRPAVVRKRFTNPIHYNNRSLHNPEILRMERDLYTLVT